MAESAVLSLASKTLSTIASPAFEKAYERGISIWEARDELDKLGVTIETIKAMLLDAEKKQESSAAVKDWIKKLKGVLYDADDLFDEVATDDLLKKQMKKENNKLSLKKKVRVFCSSLNPIVSRDSIAKKVKAIRKSLGEISADMAMLGFVSCIKEEDIPNGVRKGQDVGCFVDSKDIIGRGKDRKAILKMLFDESNNAKLGFPLVISIVGIGGMGKTALVQLIYNDDVVKRNFEKRWFGCISNTTVEKEVLGKIYQSICEGSYTDFTISQLETKLRTSTEDKNFLLVLDDVWDDHHVRWQKRMSLLGGAAKGSKIIVTTRSSAVARAVGSLKTHNLEGLSEDESWTLFKRVAFTPEQENDPRWTDLGREIVNKCRNVPLAIKSIGNLLFEKNTIQEWLSIQDEELSKLGQSHEDGIMPVLKLSYDHLSSNLKQCFAYCSLFPKDYLFPKPELIYLWMAQGYIKQNNEDVGHSHFMYLLRRGFFQEAVGDEFGEIISCKMHDLIHDLAQYVAGEESIVLTTSTYTSNCTRHVSVGDLRIDEPWSIPTSLLNVKRLRSCLLLEGGSICNPTLLDQLFVNFKWLRALSLWSLDIKIVPSSIGELKHLRYLNLSWNKFEYLPNPVTNLLNLLTLDLSRCKELKALPDDLRKLNNLRYLSILGCDKVKYMPTRMGEMSCLQYLSNFKVRKASSKWSGLDSLARLQHQLRGSLRIEFDEDWEGDECSSWQLPVSPQRLQIKRYPGIRIPHWVNDTTSAQLPNLGYIKLQDCRKVKYMPPFKCLPYLKCLRISCLEELEYMEEEVEAAAAFFPALERLDLLELPKLNGWWRRMSHVQQLLSFPLLNHLKIEGCPELKSMPSTPRICQLELRESVRVSEVIEHLLSPTSLDSSSSSSLKEITINNCKGPISFPRIAVTSLQNVFIDQTSGSEILHLASPHLESVHIWSCDGLEHVEVEAPTTLRFFSIMKCPRLKNLHIAHPNVLEELSISNCQRLCLTGLDWDSFPNLHRLGLRPLPKELPECLVHRQALGNLRIIRS